MMIIFQTTGTLRNQSQGWFWVCPQLRTFWKLFQKKMFSVSSTMEKKDYSSSKNISSVRDQYRTRYGLQAFAGNYSHSQKYASTNWLCRCKESREEESHIISGKCKVLGTLMTSLGISPMMKIWSSSSVQSWLGGTRLTSWTCSNTYLPYWWG